MSKNILFLLSGSIACYKACEVISALSKDGYNLQVAASQNALKFIGTSTLEGLSGKPVFTDEYENGRNMDHIHLIRKADLIVLCPASANTINQFASGSGGILTTLFLAYEFNKPFYVYPAMNTAMYEHPITQRSIANLKEMGISVKATGTGELACGEHGEGRLLEAEQILADIHEALT